MTRIISGSASLLLLLVGCTTITNHGSQPLAPKECVDGQVRRGFLSVATSGDTPCGEGQQVCQFGKWQGPPIYDNCQNNSKSCDGILHGTIVTGYLYPTTSIGQPCITATKTCINGVWIGPHLFPNCGEL